MECCHWSGYHDIPESYVKSLEYLNKKYPNSLYGGTVSVIGDKQVKMATDNEVLIYTIRKKYLRGIKSNG